MAKKGTEAVVSAPEKTTVEGVEKTCLIADVYQAARMDGFVEAANWALRQGVNLVLQPSTIKILLPVVEAARKTLPAAPDHLKMNYDFQWFGLFSKWTMEPKKDENKNVA